MEDDWSWDLNVVEGDHKIREESVDVDNRVGVGLVFGCQRKAVTPAS
jgi:hypothetical protein